MPDRSCPGSRFSFKKRRRKERKMCSDACVSFECHHKAAALLSETTLPVSCNRARALLERVRIPSPTFRGPFFFFFYVVDIVFVDKHRWPLSNRFLCFLFVSHHCFEREREFLILRLRGGCSKFSHERKLLETTNSTGPLC